MTLKKREGTENLERKKYIAFPFTVCFGRSFGLVRQILE